MCTVKYRQKDDDSSSEERKPGGSLTKVTLNLLPRTVKALDELSDRTGDTKTECINRAVQIYAWIRECIDGGDRVTLNDRDGSVREIRIF